MQFNCTFDLPEQNEGTLIWVTFVIDASYQSLFYAHTLEFLRNAILVA